MRRNTKLALAAAGSIAVLAVAIFWGGAEGEAPMYRTASVSRGAIAGTISASGTLRAVVSVDVGTQVSGMISVLNADFNSEVEVGQVIARIDSAPFESSLSQAEAELSVARANVTTQEASLAEFEADLAGLRSALAETKAALGRKQTLLSREVETSSAVTTARANHEQATARVNAGQARVRKQHAQIAIAQAQVQQKIAAVELRRLDLEYTYIRSPVSGVVLNRAVDVGQTVAASLQSPILFQIAQDLTHLQVSIRVDEADIGQIVTGQKVRFTVDAYPGQAFDARVHQIRKASQEVSNVVTYTVIAAADNSDHRLLPGMTANVAIIVSERGDALKVPNAALRLRLPEIYDGRSNYDSWVWVLDESSGPRVVSVTSGISDGIDAEIVGGDLQEGQTVITGIRAAAR